MTTSDQAEPITRESYASFLDKFVNNQTGSLEWDHYCVQQFGDSFLEEVRRCVVRLATDKLPIHGDTEAGRDLLRSWAFLLRSSTNSADSGKPDVVTIDMTRSEAVVLDCVLRRYSDSDKLAIENSAEQQCLWNLECLLEKNGDRPNWPTLEDALSELKTPE